MGGKRAGSTAVYWDVMRPKDAKMAEWTAGQMVVKKAQRKHSACDLAD